MEREFYLGMAIGCLGVLSFSSPVMAQVSSDGTLPVPTRVPSSVNGRDFLINNGTRSGNNLFHSFSQFSIPTNGSAIFNHATDIQNIFSRVTGSQVSNIDGTIRTQGSANLFLMNPNGILFGPNARLQLGGSFLGTTATGIKFSDGVEFNAVNSTPALLSVKVPIGLQMGTQPGTIQVNGTGHRLASSSATTAPYTPTGLTGGLSVRAGKNLALVGGPINLVGGGLTAERGRIELGSLGALETAALDTSAALWKLNTTATQRFGNITLSGRSIVDVSGSGAGSIQVQGQQISLKEGSVLFVQNRSAAPAGDVQIKADSLDIMGGLARENVRSSIINETRSGNSGNISVTARQVNLIDGGSFLSRSFGGGSSGNIDVKVRESVKIAGFLNENPEVSSTIGTISFSQLVTGRSGNITVSTPNLSIQNGGIISATTFGKAIAGNISVNADQVEITGRNQKFSASTITSSTLGTGDAGNIDITTRTLLVTDRGTIDGSGFNNGDAGSILINASESVEVGQRSYVGSAIVPGNPNLITALKLPLQPRGNAGSLIINAPLVRVRDRGQVVVSNTGLGNSGKVLITANQIKLDQKAQITAATSLGEGGDVVLTAQSLSLRQDVRISATAGGAGNGGNIKIDSPIIIGLGNSDIVANAKQGKGGNIKITTQGMFGLQYSDRITPENDITASSEFGINGNVQVNTIGVNPTNTLNALPVDVVDSSSQIADRCGNAKGGSLVATGRGGMPQGPTKRHGSDRTWNDLRSNSLQASAIANPIAKNSSQPIVEATALHRDETGNITLIAPNPITNSTTATCGMALR